MSTDTPTPTVPDFRKFMNPCLAVLCEQSDPMTNEELEVAVAKHMALSKEVVAIPHDAEKNPKPEVFYRLAWARTYLKKLGLIDNPERGSWQASDKGRASGRVDPTEVVRLVTGGADADSLSEELPDALVEELLAIYPRAIEDRNHPVGDELRACYARFRARFGPDMLRQANGQTLLEAMHGRGTKDSLAYWLEFKNDEEMPAAFGSIAGGSALKFGIYQSAETGHWMTGHPMSQKRLSVKEAIQLVEGQRAQLLAGAEVLAEYAPESADYKEMQARMVEAAPDLAESAWGHKYFALLFPDLLDDYHNLDYQKFHLIRLHKLPADGRYENARIFAAIARQLGMPITHLGTTLNARDGDPRSTWRVGTSVGDGAESEWPRMRDGGFAAIGWSDTGDISAVERNRAGKEYVRSLIEKHHPNKGAHAGARAVVTKAANQLFAFATRVVPGDTIVAMDGGRVLGIGEATGVYYFEPGDGPFAHRQPVRWRSFEEWKLPKPEGLRTTFVPLMKHAGNLVEIARRLDTASDDGEGPTSSSGPVRSTPAQPLQGLLGRIQSALARKGQVILYGPPGTGKTYWAIRALNELAARSWYGKSHEDLSDEEGRRLEDEGAIAQCTFHPAYGYEDFLVGYRPEVEGGNLTFVPRDGIFARVCARAAAQPERHHFLLVDEINRGDIPRIFGELLTVLEKDKRGTPVLLPTTARRFTVPPNVFLVGTMNTADRSIALLDAALRRRFAFIELMPDSRVLQGVSIEGLPVGAWLDELNRRVVRHAGRDSRNLQVGHSYLMSGGLPIRDAGRFVEVLRDDVVPLLQEYCYDDFESLEQILGSALVRVERKAIDETLFEPGRRADLFGALLAAFEGITATSAAADADVEDLIAEDDAGEDEEDEEDDASA